MSQYKHVCVCLYMFVYLYILSDNFHKQACTYNLNSVDEVINFVNELGHTGYRLEVDLICLHAY